MIGLRRPALPLSDPACLLATWFGSGLIKPASGTWGSLAALPVAWILAWWVGPLGLLMAAILAFGLGCWAADRYERADPGKDPSAVVIDEVAGLWLVLTLASLTIRDFALGFLLFRLFDIVKLWPISWADRKVGGGLGIMLDDLLAALYAGAALLLIKQAIGE